MNKYSNKIQYKHYRNERKRNAQARRIGAKWNWFTFRRKLENAKSKVKSRLARGRMRKLVLPHLKQNIVRVRKNYPRRFHENYKPSLMNRRFTRPRKRYTRG